MNDSQKLSVAQEQVVVSLINQHQVPVCCIQQVGVKSYSGPLF